MGFFVVCTLNTCYIGELQQAFSLRIVIAMDPRGGAALTPGCLVYRRWRTGVDTNA